MIRSFSDHLRREFPAISTESKLLIAFSGGSDSVVLTTLLYRLGYDISLAHVNFSLREKESDEDEVFAREFAEEKGLEFYSTHVNTNKYAAENQLSTQEAARKFRYEWFDELLNTEDLDFILTAHHADDQLETVFINMIRGSGLKGFTGIPRERDDIIRPLLPYSKDRLLEFANENGLSWREDSSNASTDYLRNKIRHELIPSFRGITKDAFRQAIKSIGLADESYRLFEDLLQEKRDDIVSVTDDGYSISLEKLEKEEHPRTLLFHFIKDLGFTNIDEVYQLSNKPRGKIVQNKEYRITKERDRLVIQPLEKNFEPETFRISLSSKVHRTPIGNLNIRSCNGMDGSSKNIAYIDADKIDKALILRKWKKGDHFYPLGMKGRKKLSDFLKDEKVPHHKKSDQWVLTSNEQIVWVVGHRVDDRFKINDNTKRCLKITCSAD